jgi:hypothetical protein
MQNRVGKFEVTVINRRAGKPLGQMVGQHSKFAYCILIAAAMSAHHNACAGRQKICPCLNVHIAAFKTQLGGQSLGAQFCAPTTTGPAITLPPVWVDWYGSHGLVSRHRLALILRRATMCGQTFWRTGVSWLGQLCNSYPVTLCFLSHFRQSSSEPRNTLISALPSIPGILPVPVYCQNVQRSCG